MKKILIELWVDDNLEVNDENVGSELGKALLTNSGNLSYYEEEGHDRDAYKDIEFYIEIEEKE